MNKLSSSSTNFSIHNSAQNGNKNEVKALLKQGVDINLRDVMGNTPLHLAVRYKHLKIVKILIQVPDCDLTATNSRGQTPEMLAYKKNALEIHRLLVNNCKDYSEKLDKWGYALIHNAAELDLSEKVKEIVEHGVNINLTTITGYTPLHKAILNNCDKVISYLLSQNNCVVLAKNDKKETSLTTAYDKKKYNTARILISKAIPRATEDIDIHGRSLLHYAVELDMLDEAKKLIAKGFNVNLKDAKGETSLHLAIRHNKENIVKYLIQVPDCDLIATNARGQTTQMLASKKSSRQIELLIISSCKDYSENLDKWENALIHYAAMRDVAEKVKELVEHGVNINLTNGIGNTALHEAIIFNSAKVFSYLLSQENCDILTKNDDNETPITLAYEKKNYLQKLITRATPKATEVVDKYGRSLLHYAAEFSMLEVAKELIAKGFNVLLKDTKGETPLFLASLKTDYFSHSNLMKNLLIKNAVLLNPIEEIDSKGRSLLHYAALCGPKEDIKTLIKKGFNLNLEDQEGNTPFLLAANSGRYANAIFLNSQKESKWSKNEFNLLIELCKQYKNSKEETKKTNLLRFLLNKVRKIPLPTSFKTNLSFPHLNALLGLNKNVKRYLENWGDINLLDEEGETLLHKAVRGQNKPLVKLLLKYNDCNIHIQNKLNETPLDLANKSANQKIISILSNPVVNVQYIKSNPWASNPSGPVLSFPSKRKPFRPDYI